ncbi:hypothetical protein LCM4576_01580 [Mesorhizobium sp. LCM 4576]|uniref:hypothetical protein n=1 Tax=Mesorhizobium sp. LCM 4576 TaxID=1848289 RepID=UPI0008DA1443|nr:hypothetical protein [Mesorhizobium sp. LCM 4576]OHV68424.1 hypothetical protein LCM4576_01580 [Mesorhizobium sp. LCM 4576]
MRASFAEIEPHDLFMIGRARSVDLAHDDAVLHQVEPVGEGEEELDVRSTTISGTPLLEISPIAAPSSSLRRGERPSVGSSSIRRRGAHISAQPIDSICRSPPDKVLASCVLRSARRGKRA